VSRQTAWNMWPHGRAIRTTSSARCSAQIEQSDSSGWGPAGTMPVMKNSPWLRRAGMLEGGVVLVCGTARSLEDDDVSLGSGALRPT